MLAWLVWTDCGPPGRSVDDGTTEVTWDAPLESPPERSGGADNATREVASTRAVVHALTPNHRSAPAVLAAAPAAEVAAAEAAPAVATAVPAIPANTPTSSASETVGASGAGGTGAGNGSGRGVDATGASSPTRRVGMSDRARGSRARGAALGASRDWSDCDFPDGDRGGLVRVQVRVRRDGTPAAVTVLDAPHPKLGRYAARCAMSRSYFAALDESGRPTEEETAPFLVYFTR